MWYEGNICNMYFNDLVMYVKKGVLEVELVGMCFNMVGVSDGILMGIDGMSYLL